MEEMALDVTMAEAERTSLEMTARGVDKGTGLENLCRMLNLPLAQAIVVGDADNDLGSLQKAGLAVAMGNANEAVRAAAGVWRRSRNIFWIRMQKSETKRCFMAYHL